MPSDPQECKGPHKKHCACVCGRKYIYIYCSVIYYDNHDCIYIYMIQLWPCPCSSSAACSFRQFLASGAPLLGNCWQPFKVVIDMFNSLDLLATFSNGIWDGDIKLSRTQLPAGLGGKLEMEHPMAKGGNCYPPQIAWLMDHHPLFSGILSQVCHNGLVGTGTAKGWQILEVNGGELSMYRPCRFPSCWNDLQGTMVYSQGMLLLSLLPRMEFLLILKNYHHGTHKYNSVVYKFISDCPLGTMFRFHIL